MRYPMSLSRVLNTIVQGGAYLYIHLSLAFYLIIVLYDGIKLKTGSIIKLLKSMCHTYQMYCPGSNINFYLSLAMSLC